MDMKQVYIVFILNFVNGRGVKDPCQTYQSINKENIRNCLGGNGTDRDFLAKNVSLKAVSGSDYLKDNVTSDYLDYLKDHMDLSSNITMELQLSDFAVSLFYKDKHGEGRKMKTSMSNMMQYMLVPAFLMSGLMPWIMPKLQMAVMMVSMMNNMVFTSGLAALIRSYVFEKEPTEHVIYVNHGYKKKGHYNYG
ncbi:uncharacterized protein [Leptinotarsa decemlineata]|uniref:uncharacterized protein n=1 Tax=Leptinotarsa decemlineata TaxID=7539 RepID=UPI003D30B135